MAVADGGEDTSEVIVESNDGVSVPVQVHKPLMQKIDAKYGIIDNGEMETVYRSMQNFLKLENQYYKTMARIWQFAL